MKDEYFSKITLEVLELPKTDKDPLLEPQHPGPIEGWYFKETVYFKDGRSVTAEGTSNNPNHDGRTEAICITHDNLYNTAINAGIPYIHKRDTCSYYVEKDDLRDEYPYETRGPFPIRNPFP